MIIHVKAEVNEANAKNAMAKTDKRGGPAFAKALLYIRV